MLTEMGKSQIPKTLGATRFPQPSVLYRVIIKSMTHTSNFPVTVSWSSSSLLFLRDKLLSDYNFKEDCVPSQSRIHVTMDGDGEENNQRLDEKQRSETDPMVHPGQ
jgi:hypothetical protein